MKNLNIICIIIFLSISNIANNKIYNIEVKYNINKKDKSYNYDINNYNEVIDYIKKHEGYRANPYYCLAGKKTVGYGHVITDDDSLIFPIDSAIADSILKQDFNKSMKYVENTMKLDSNKLLAIAHFVYATGSGNFHKSTIRKYIKNNWNIKWQIRKWTYIKTKKGYINSKYLLKMRNFELELYYR